MSPRAVPTWSTLAAAIMLATLGCFVGWVAHATPGAGSMLVIGRTAGLAFFLAIVLRNVVAIGLLVAGVATRGITAAIGLVVNGFRVARFVSLLRGSGISPANTIRLLAPHGVIEFPLLLVAGAIGLHGCRAYRDREHKPLTAGHENPGAEPGALRSLDPRLLGALLAALLLAASLETWVSHPIAARLLPTAR